MITGQSEQFWTPHGVRLRRARTCPGRHNWLFFPGGPGIGSECLAGLVEGASLPGTSWLVDLPGDGSNVDAPGAPADPYGLWPDVLSEAVDAVADPVVIGHSTGGEYLLSVPTLEERIAGLVLISSAPDARWLPTFATMAAGSPLPGLDEAVRRFEIDPSPERLRDVVISSAGWNFEPGGLVAGLELLDGLPYNPAAVAWSAASFDRSYAAAWWPRELSTLIISGGADRIVDQSRWREPHHQGRNVEHSVIDGAGHWPWVERPAEVREALTSFSIRLPSVGAMS